MLLIKTPNYLNTIHKEICPEPNEKQKEVFYKKLAETAAARGDAEPEKTDSALHIAEIIKTAFEFELSFKQFAELAYCAGYYIPEDTVWPPYYLLKSFLDAKNYNYEEYKRELTDLENIKLYLELGTADIDNFSYRIRKNYYLYINKYASSFREARQTQEFKESFLQFFFRHQYLYDDLYSTLFKIDKEAANYQFMHTRFCGMDLEFVRRGLSPTDDEPE